MQTLHSNPSPVPEQISKVAEMAPSSVALSHGCRQLTYAELDSKADRLAAYLSQRGLVPGGAVAICMERSFDWIVAALGVMRAGGAYVPLDLAWPEARLCYAIDDSGAAFVVARAALLNRLQVKAQGLDPDRDAAAIASAQQSPRKALAPESLAYVIYTSGSTGVPKGVEITHANLCNLTDWHRQAFGVTEKDRASHLAGLGFDAAVWELWPNLAAGATICLGDDAVRSSPELIKQWMIRERISIGFVPTVHASPMIAVDWPETTSLHYLLTGGDALHHHPKPQLPFKVVNNYGPTEGTVVSTSGILDPGLSGTPSIGSPISGTSLYLLDESGQQVPRGTAGEIYVGGRSIGRGYRNLPDLTKQCFVPDPFAGTPDARMYRTGDRGALLPNGEVEFRGRLDRQTKIRGQRVELDEISSILSGHSAVGFAAVLATTSPSGENVLVAYVLPKDSDTALTAHDLQNHLLRTLPDYMVPAIFVRLRELPVSPNGKLDLKNLPSPVDAELLDGRPERAPASPIEERLLAMVREILGNKSVSAQDSFFLAGGHSLLGMQLVMRLRETFGVELTLRQLFEAPTVERLAVVIESLLIDSIDSLSDEEAKTQLME